MPDPDPECIVNGCKEPWVYDHLCEKHLSDDDPSEAE